MMRRRWITLALALTVGASVACNPPPTLPPPAGAETDSTPRAQDSSVQESTPTCQTLGGRCTEPGNSCPIQITGKDPCGPIEGGPSGQICCAGN